MSIIADKMNDIKPSPTLEIASKAMQLKAMGVDIISLSAGEPDFDTPNSVKEAAIKAINAGKTKYTLVDGTVELKEAISYKIYADYGIKYNINQISVGTGAKQCIYNLFMSTLNPNDEVLIPSPYWVSYPDIVKIAGGKPVTINCNENFKISVELLEKSITENTKWLIINSPNNPTGMVYTKKELKDIAQVLLKYSHVHVMTDDIYAKLVYGVKFLNIVQVEPSLYDRVFIVNGVSKAYAMTGWRIGYVTGNEKVIKAISMIQSQSTTNPNSIAQAATIEALMGDQDFLKERLKLFSERRDIVMNMINHAPGLSAISPQGAFYVFVSCEKMIGMKSKNNMIIRDGTDFSKYLLQDYNIAVVPGSAFGAENFFRISYATSNKLLLRACERITQACTDLYSVS
ncbi:pyridoxal phosphate-dependent aminotransferase [Neoehrlichia mikurensis]|uniref:Probable aspartate/prephenate aminotransferase n=1 Tax=Neoehrlichia mikurensis TaxID=89586 RepID=A0A9Q9F3M2_9RICK|nr:pyridoxal phosphate-dependent aminotransferase [Neoehrlichia mikurensis]QXK92027.1 pyridoxal phosphate-dependent aminotransferase [Neoehrlichia mikurensis]QXK92485.1 pyridoxal phosphate-dependent aminotransferase [Neoehrlichia mikurensis]QXK93720.1 pyridoxal phosphate-dependent aminotransferase [Neoehrlichia mikurensis]UTO55307.1 pyridoxal phosphate-dependent aminotransferase [Neoehrlichia mikurensis]UTO56227.1 pyridoxal phosphate-dependent aminotransferase [Neoehrlichia mikurensis]